VGDGGGGGGGEGKGHALSYRDSSTHSPSKSMDSTVLICSFMAWASAFSSEVGSSSSPKDRAAELCARFS
jgi:hypothetical protein